MRAYYEQGKERDRLVGSKGALESERTKEILQRRMPPAPAVVADVGGGPGHYALWLAEHGTTVQHRDLMSLHVDQLEALGIPSIQTAVGDARDLDLPDSSADAVLLLGPLYHLPEREDRLKTLREAHRIVRRGGPIFVAAISRWAPRLDGVLQERLYEDNPDFLSLLPEVELTGELPPVCRTGSWATPTVRTTWPTRSRRPACISMIWSVWRVCHWPRPICSPGSATQLLGMCSSTRHEPSNGFPSCWASALT